MMLSHYIIFAQYFFFLNKVKQCVHIDGDVNGNLQKENDDSPMLSIKFCLNHWMHYNQHILNNIIKI